MTFWSNFFAEPTPQMLARQRRPRRRHPFWDWKGTDRFGPRDPPLFRPGLFAIWWLIGMTVGLLLRH